VGVLHRIYFDTNDQLAKDFYDLSLSRSQEDLARIDEAERAGLRVVIYMTGELELQTILEFDKEAQRWGARAVKGTTIHYY
jgi:hypothetical protein